MKKQILLIILSCFCLSIHCQNRTKITGFLTDYTGQKADVELNVFYPRVIGQGHRVVYNTSSSKGYFEYDLDLVEPVAISVSLNGKTMFFPGSYSIIINPGDSIHIEIPDAKKLGIMDLKFSGRGSEKVIFQKAIVAAKLALYKKDPDYKNQTLEYKFKSTDQKLSAIDSVWKHYKGNIQKSDRDLIRAAEYDPILDMLIYSSMNSSSDSLKLLFSRYVVKRNRVKPFLIDNVIHYSGLTVLRDFILLCEFNNPIKHGGVGIRKENPVEYCKLVIKHLSKYPAAKEYLLSDLALNVFSNEQDSENTRSIYQLYSDNVNQSSPFYGTVMDSYQIVMSRLKKGMPFYPFVLVDSTGRKNQLKDFKGKVVILDFWFNGCGGCRQIAPIMEELEKEYKDKNIKFISVSIDSDKDIWLKGIGKYSSKSSLQLFTEGLETKHPLVKFLNPRGYPFLIAIDPEGKLIGPPPDPRRDVATFKRFINANL
ncbi:TlpA family protein disulfide reductase [Chryseobacterium sp. T20]|uniref:TlpA family protein disulfide reductase n=1 Tax=Chryseobacterium sp. T20 TaxID=3395375 RepID=UPI0039BD4CA9